MAKKVKPISYPTEEVKSERTVVVRKCGCVGDFGHTNVYGSPYLKFDVMCHLPEGHEGPHEGKFGLSVVPTSEPNGRNIDRSSVKLVTQEAVIQWAVKD